MVFPSASGFFAFSLSFHEIWYSLNVNTSCEQFITDKLDGLGKMWKPLLLVLCQNIENVKTLCRDNATSCSILNNVTSYWNVNFYMTSFVCTVKLGKQLQLKRNTFKHKAIIFCFIEF